MFGIAGSQRLGDTTGRLACVNKCAKSTIHMAMQVFHAIKGAIRCFRSDHDRPGGALVSGSFYNTYKPAAFDPALTRTIYKDFLHYVHAAGL